MAVKTNSQQKPATYTNDENIRRHQIHRLLIETVAAVSRQSETRAECFPCD